MKDKQNLSSLVLHYASQPPYPSLSYATVRDYCDGVDHFPWLATLNDLKDAERPWAVKAVLNCLPPGMRLLEVGGGDPVTAATLVSFGYEVVICDPFDGTGNGPTEFEAYQKHYPNVKFIRARFTAEVARLFPSYFDGIYSVSVLEHVQGEDLTNVFAATSIALKPGGCSIHVIDLVLQGNGDAWHKAQILEILKFQNRLTSNPTPEPLVVAEVRSLFERAGNDLETFYLSPQGHNQWRCGQPYDAFPFRKCIAVQSIVRHLDAAAVKRAG
jgi:Methyltransferase domain